MKTERLILAFIEAVLFIIIAVGVLMIYDKLYQCNITSGYTTIIAVLLSARCILKY